MKLPRSSSTTPTAALLHRKCACGNPASAGTCAECARRNVSNPADHHEKEAERVADQVSTARPADRGTTPTIQRLASESAAPPRVPGSVDRTLESAGSPLEPVLRQDMEQRFGHDFSNVRVHADSSADQSARDVRAHAYTVGRDIVFASGKYAPQTRQGRHLLAHELTHVVQGGGTLARAADSERGHMLMRQPAKKDEAAPVADLDPCMAPDPMLPTFTAADENKRNTILKDMLRGVAADEKKAWCKRLRRALAAFSTSQMEALNTAGVRFWRSGGFPPPFDAEFAPSKTGRYEMARYEYPYRVISWGPRAGVDEVRHELAHAWDHVRDGKIRRLDNYKGAQLKKEMLAPTTFASETNKKRVTVADPAGAGTKQVGLSIKDTFDRFMKRPVQGYWSFRNSKTDPEHVTSNVKEFYAEGYSVFHGGDEDAQAQLLCAAPELYQLLEKEALAEKLAVPDRKKLDANNASNKRACS